MFIAKTPILIVHLLGLCMALGPVLLLDWRLARLLLGVPVTRRDAEMVELLMPCVRVGLLLLCASGVGFLIYYALETPEALNNPKLHAKLAIVAVLALNGLLVERYAVSQISVREGLSLLDPHDARQRRSLLAIGAVSATSWYAALLLGTIRELNFACSIAPILAGYLAAVAVAMLCLTIFVQIGRRRQLANQEPQATQVAPAC